MSEQTYFGFKNLDKLGGPDHTPEYGYGFRTLLRSRTWVRERKMSGVRVNVDFIVRKSDGDGLFFFLIGTGKGTEKFST